MGKFQLFAKILLSLLSAYVVISLLTFSPLDISEVSYPASSESINKGGIIGAYTAYYLYSYLGLGSFLFIALSLILLFINQKKKSDRFIFITGAVFLQLSVLTLLSIQGVVKPDYFGLAGVMADCGGLVGNKFQNILSRYFGTFGAAVCGVLALLFSTSLMLEQGILPALIWIKKTFLFMVYISIRIYDKLKDFFTWLKMKRMKRLQQKLNEQIMKEEDELEAEYNVLPATTSEQDEPEEQIEAQAEPISVKSKEEPAVGSMLLQSENNPVPVKRAIHYEYPPIELFDNKIEKVHDVSKQEMDLRKKMIVSALEEFGVQVKVVQYEEGPTVTLYELELAPGTRISEVSKLTDELSMKLMVPNIRIIAPLPGKGTVGVEVPNPFPNTVRVRGFLENMGRQLKKVPLPLLLGKTNVGEPLVKNLTDMPHLLIAGTTGSGKSICLKSLITGLVSLKSPDELKLFLIDPKMVELTLFEDIPHLWAPVITDSRKATYVLDWLIKEMDDRYIMFNKLHVMKIETFNQLGKDEIGSRLTEKGMTKENIEKFPISLPYVVVVIDELADLMLSSSKEVENAIIRLSQKARAVGIHIIAATQRPSTDVVTGLIKSNMPARISFKVASQIESRIILDSKGAERLLGKGDMLFIMPGMNTPVRAQCTYSDENETFRLTKFLKTLGDPVYREDLLEINNDDDWEGSEDDEMFEESCRIVLENKRGSISLIQRKLQIGYQRAARLVEAMEKVGIVGSYNGAKSREVLMTVQQWEEKRKAQQASNT
ncbi:MAG: DNA translocase FtsK [Planctomycetes bacterium]|nr:DNA translocase FtsK [Planctomycetota bacterium]